ncbi:hypothetical protein JAAARDRAFT_62411 [Jaapia argillacea MUCL 33604]|uniref:Uncharacterized protein n=1 Tax=Jaapia argillacea MUCL 33604 TaxID=933084 RepID=A0A067PKI3_9AGAM|nr:hypothetical protein JAAARDRAFT_62411 [Jaapia argillacea MUCL 33604]
MAAGLEWECPPLVLFIDDVSGNSTKQWNVHYSCYLSNGGLPHTAVEKESHIRFVVTSPHASPMEIITAICDEIKKTGGTTLVKAWDCIHQRYILIRLWLLFLPGDNLMQAELCSHIGLMGNHLCHCCHAGGTKEFKESDGGYPTLMSPGTPRTVEETRKAVMNQLIMATHAAAEKPLKEVMTSSGVKDSLAMPTISRLIAIGKLLRRSTPQHKALSPEGVAQQLHEEFMKRKDLTMINPLLRMARFDVHKDTPIEALHTHLLSIVKHFWAQTVWSGLNIPNIMADYMCRYHGGLIGKHFKTISQVMAFAVCSLVEEKLQTAWFAIGRLTVMIWEVEIKNLKQYTARISI